MFYAEEIRRACALQGVSIFVSLLSSTPPVEQILFRGETIPFCILKGSRRRKRLAIRVTREGQVEVLVPPRASRKDALRAVASRGEWILRHVHAMKIRPQAAPLLYTSGEAHWFLGREYVLDVACKANTESTTVPEIPAVLPTGSKTSFMACVRTFFGLDGTDDSDKPKPVRLKRRSAPEVCLDASEGRLLVRLSAPDPEVICRALQGWYRTEALRILAERLNVLCPAIPWLSGIPPWKVKLMRRRWGSCTARGELTFNTHLIKAPVQCIDYVLLHELAHLRELNHSKHYYAVLEHLLPEWKRMRCELETLAPLLLNI